PLVTASRREIPRVWVWRRLMTCDRRRLGQLGRARGRGLGGLTRPLGRGGGLVDQIGQVTRHRQHPRLPFDADPHPRVRCPKWPDRAELPAVGAVTDNHLGDRLAVDIGEVGDPLTAELIGPYPQSYA